MRNTDTLAKNILDSIGDAGQVTRKYYQRRLPEDPSKDYYFIMRDTGNITPLLIEYGFIDNPNDARRLQNNILNYAEAVVKAVANYTGYQYVTPGGQLENTYTVVQGDSLYSIARRFNTTVAELRRLNNLTTDTLQVGQVLIINDVTTPAPDDNFITYVVKSGDSLYRIAQQYNTTVKDIIELNNLNSTSLSIGQTLKIPVPTSKPTNNYTVQSGDSLYSIARKFGVTVQELIDANNLSTNTLQIGQVLIIPGNNNPSIDDNYFNYTVISGDSLYSIANKFNTTVNEIKRLNNLSSNTLQIGQVLKIPGSSPNYINYTVVRGDSLYSIANRFNTSVNEIKKLNNLSSNTLQIGQILKIPQ